MKDFIAKFLIFDACITILLFALLGVDGMARLACNFYNADVCEDLKQDEMRDPKPVRRSSTGTCARVRGVMRCS